MKIKIYLNDGEDHFFGFKNDFANSPELTMVHSFEYELEEQYPVQKVLHWIYRELNVDFPNEQWAKEYRGKYLRSLSVGDVVTVGETAWAVADMGFERVTTEELQNAIVWNDELNGVPE